MSKVVRLTESDLIKLVKRVIKEHTPSSNFKMMKGIMYINEFKEWVNTNYPKLAVKLKISKNDPKDETKLTQAFNYIIKKEDNVQDAMGRSNAEGQKLGELFMRDTDQSYNPLKV